MEISPAELKKIQKIELDILKQFHQVCEELNIKYTICSGTLLGAIRHKGFIPWDDDIDVAMLREDYNIFLEKGQRLLDDNLFIQTYETDKNYPLYFAKIRDVSTTLFEQDTKDVKMENGIYIDIIPIDKITSNKIKRTIGNYLIYIIGILKDSTRTQRIFSSANNAIKGVRLLLYPITRLIGSQNLNRLETYIREKGNKDTNQYTTADILTPYKKDAMLMPIDLFYNYENIMFEGQNFRSIKNTDLYLSAIYGEYMKLPPKNKRVSHHNFIKVEFKRED